MSIARILHYWKALILILCLVVTYHFITSILTSNLKLNIVSANHCPPGYVHVEELTPICVLPNTGSCQIVTAPPVQQRFTTTTQIRFTVRNLALPDGPQPLAIRIFKDNNFYKTVDGSFELQNSSTVSALTTTISNPGSYEARLVNLGPTPSFPPCDPISFNVHSEIPSINCTGLTGYDPEPPRSGGNVRVLYAAKTGSGFDPEAYDPNNHYAKFEGNTIRLKALDETTWYVDLGTIDSPGTYSVAFYYAPTSLPSTAEGLKCGEYSFNIEGFGSGKNPCIDTDGDGSADKCSTAFGDIPTDITKFAGKVLSIALGIAGGIALILLVYGSIRVLTSTGNPQNVAAGRDIIVAAIAGLLFLIFSVLILRALGLIVGVPFL